jgi:DNA-binding response OmpR family regulator
MLVAMLDENRDFLDMVAAALEYANHRVAPVHVMEQACARLRVIGPDAILLNVWTYPRERGWQVLLALQVDQALRAIPVIVYSSSRQDLEAHAEMLQRARCQILVTPFHLAELYAAIDRVTLSGPGITA